MATVAPNSAKPRSVFFVNPFVDFMMIGGASIFAYIAFKYFQGGARTYYVYTIAAWLAWVCNWPHFSATSWRLYGSRENVRSYSATAWLVPFVVLAGILGSFLSPKIVAPLFVKLFLIWSPYHFSGQTVGVSMVYARRSGIVVPPWARRALGVFVFGTYLTQTLRAETAITGIPYYGIMVPGFGVPTWMPQLAELGMFAAGGALLVFAALWSIRNRRAIHYMFLLPAVTQFIWFVPGSLVPSFQEYVPFFHSLQYLLIAWAMQLFEKSEAAGGIRGAFVLSESAKWSIGNFVGGSILFYFLPMLGAWMGGVPLAFATGVVISGVQIHHFFVDGVIWKLKRRTVVSPLMMSLSDLRAGPGILEAAPA